MSTALIAARSAAVGAVSVKGAAVIAAFLAAGIALGLLHHEKLPRIRAIMLAFAAFCAASGVTVWTDALASLVQSVTGLAVLAGVTAVTGLSFWFQGVRGHKYHHLATPVLSIAFGTSLVLFLGNLGTFIRAGLLNPATATQAVGGAVSRINSGKAAQSGMAMTTSHRNMILLIGAVAVIGLLVLARRLGGSRSRAPRPGRRPAPAPPPGRGGGRPAIGRRS